MELNAAFFLLAVPAVIFAGISKGGFGSGAAFAATPFLALILPPGQAVGLMLPLLMLMDVAAIGAYWRKWDWPRARLLMLGALPGIALGALLAGRADPDLFRLLIGLVALGFVAWQGVRAAGWLKLEGRSMGAGGGIFWGAVAGLTSFISHAGGPPAAVYLLTQGLTKQAFQATTVIVFFAINLMKFGPYLALGIFTRQTALADLFLAPAAFAGVYLGVWMHRRVSERVFFGITYVLLTITGAKLVWDALT